ncbi:leukemia inhibitory factor receptor-like isoform X2 [Anguilla anguilla]|uniref:leukemia inhibitory factor receptor-like isoform X2 n=1 Tax=Anguilla anguilla TaxID=7936 RepID=UPI0015AF4C7E|nr:leukemia inhibitory factor receptor-like isoform X2 [Anguilla anguilla]
MGIWVLCTLYFVLSLQGNHGSDATLGLTMPHAVELEIDWVGLRISVCWKLDHFPTVNNLTESLLFDIEVLQNEDVVHNVTTEADPLLKKGRWCWTSRTPLECPPHSYRVRSRRLDHTSQWSPKLTVDETAVPSREPVQVYPVEKVVAVGSTVRFCCIVGRGRALTDIKYNNEVVDATPIGAQSYMVALRNVTATKSSANAVFCSHNDTNPDTTGSSLFVGYPPGDCALVCETDLESVECQWDPGRQTKLSGNRRTTYTLNGRNCSQANQVRKPSFRCKLGKGLCERNRTLKASNPLGSLVLTDTADLNHRVRLQRPFREPSAEVNAWNASVQWRWPLASVRAHEELHLLCQVQLMHSGLTNTSNYTGRWLSELVLRDLQPGTNYSLQIRCGTQQNFWKWSDWSFFKFKTKEDRPGALDVWMQMNSSHSALILWRPLSASESHGRIRGYEVSWDSSLRGRRSSKLPPEKHSLLLQDMGHGVVTVTAFNGAGSSPPSSVGFAELAGGTASVSRIPGSGGGFNLSWPASANATCGYAVEWSPAHSGRGRTVEWVRVPAQRTWARIPPECFTAGLKYSLSIYSCSQGILELLARREEYSEERAPDQPVQNLQVKQSGSEVRLRWDGVPLEGQRGLIRGYSVHRASASGLVSENITDPEARGYAVRNLPLGHYTFTVRAFTAAGEGSGAVVSIQLSPYSDSLICVILISLGTMACVLILTTVTCYRKRKWMKEKFYSDIPQPKLSHNWATTPILSYQGMEPMHIPYDSIEIMSHLAENSGVDHGEEKGGCWFPPDTDSSCPPYIGCYQQAPGRRSYGCVPPAPLAPPAPSLETRRTGVTYTAVCTPLMPTQGVPPPVEYKPQISAPPHALPLWADDGYQPHPRHCPGSPGVESLDPSLDTPTSANSFTFLLGGAASVGRPEQTCTLPSPVELNGVLPYRNYTNPSYMLTDTSL